MSKKAFIERGLCIGATSWAHK